MVYEYSQVTNSREAYCLDHIQPTKFQYRAFRYAHLHYINHGGVIPSMTDKIENCTHPKNRIMDCDDHRLNSNRNGF